MLTAKMIGMTPAWLTRSGRNVVPPWYIRLPRTRPRVLDGDAPLPLGDEHDRADREHREDAEDGEGGEVGRIEERPERL